MKRTILIAAVGAFAVGFFQNCSPMQAASYGDAKKDFYQNHSILGTDNIYKSPQALAQVAETNEGTPTNVPVPVPVDPLRPVQQVEEVKLPLKGMCDKDKFYWWNANGVAATTTGAAITIRIEKDGVKWCEITGEAAKTMVINKSVTLPAQCLGNLSKDQFMAQLAYTDRTKPIKFLIYATKPGTNEVVQINDPKKRKGNKAPMQQLDPSWIYYNRGPNEKCDQTVSPLFIDTRPASDFDNQSRLSAPDFGVYFNILGDYPIAPFTANQQIRISWFTDPKLMLLTLPNAAGHVEGPNELFGDRTKGPGIGVVDPNNPEHDNPDHGFHALAKYDGYIPPGETSGKYSTVPDGRIDAKDWVWKKLRLWSDRNFNARSDAGELIPLDDPRMNFVSIDLNFDPLYREMDRYKNEIMFKSVAVKKDGSFNLIFDVWFALPK